MLTKLEVKRQITHMFTGFIIILGILEGIIRCFWLGIAFIIVCFFSLSIKKGYRIPIFSFFLDHFQRSSERKGIPAKGFIFYLLGSFLACFFYEHDISLASIAILAVGDSTSRLVGPFGYIKHPFSNVKFVEGIIAGGIVATLAAMLFVPFHYALIGSFVAMMIESLDLKIKGQRVDDNVLIPVFGGLIMQVFRLINL